MEKYKPIRQLMADGEFSKALDHLIRILQKNPARKFLNFYMKISLIKEVNLCKLIAPEELAHAKFFLK